MVVVRRSGWGQNFFLCFQCSTFRSLHKNKHYSILQVIALNSRLHAPLFFSLLYPPFIPERQGYRSGTTITPKFKGSPPRCCPASCDSNPRKHIHKKKGKCISVKTDVTIDQFLCGVRTLICVLVRIRRTIL